MWRVCDVIRPISPALQWPRHHYLRGCCILPLSDAVTATPIAPTSCASARRAPICSSGPQEPRSEPRWRPAGILGLMVVFNQTSGVLQCLTFTFCNEIRDSQKNKWSQERAVKFFCLCCFPASRHTPAQPTYCTCVRLFAGNLQSHMPLICEPSRFGLTGPQSLKLRLRWEPRLYVEVCVFLCVCGKRCNLIRFSGCHTFSTRHVNVLEWSRSH